jgi:arylsulfatase A-like enzyme
MRMFLDKVYGLCNLILLSASLFASLGEAHFAERPNVIILYTDDHGSLDLGSFGATDLETPNMDAIVQSGIRLTQFYAAPVCTPSRVSLMTGQAPHRMGLAGNITAVSGQTDGLRTESFTLVDLFKSGGYRTAHIGKWHLGFSSETQPLAHGFDHSFGHLVGCIDNYSHFYYWRGPNRHDLYRNGEEVFYQGQYFPELMLTEAMEFIDSVNDQPFFVYFAMNAPHYPYQGKEKWLRHYKEKDMSEARRLYAAFLSTQDEIIGELLTYLEKKGLRENTIIILQGDNGHSVEERAHFGGGYTGPYRGAKASLFEGGIRVPAAISWPHALPAGQTRDQFAVNTDWLPTLAELCDLNLPSEKRDGTSLVSILKEPTAPDTHPKGYAWTFRNQWAVRMGNWKLMMNPLTNQTNPEGKRQSYPGKMLVNLAEDPSEQNNLIDRFPGRAAAMENLYNLWKKQPLSGID